MRLPFQNDLISGLVTGPPLWRVTVVLVLVGVCVTADSVCVVVVVVAALRSCRTTEPWRRLGSPELRE